MPRGDQLARQWRLLQLISRPAGVTIDDAARELGCRGVWVVEEDFKACLPLKLTLAELAALVMSRELLAPVGASVLGGAVQSAHERIASVLSRDALALLGADARDRRRAHARRQAPSAPRRACHAHSAGGCSSGAASGSSTTRSTATRRLDATSIPTT